MNFTFMFATSGNNERGIKMNIFDLMIDNQIRKDCVYFIVEDETKDVIAIFYGEDPSTVRDAAIAFDVDGYGETSIHDDAGKIGFRGEFNETTDTQYFEV